MRRALASLSVGLLAFLLTVACTSSDDPHVVAVAPSTNTATPVAAPAGTPVALQLADPAERARVEQALAGSPDLEVTRNTATAAVVVADTEVAGATPIVLARWAAITDQRRDVLELTRDEVVAALRGDVTDWSDLGGSPLALVPYLPASQAARIAVALGIPAADLAATELPDAEIVDRVASEPGAFALVAPEELRVGVLAIVVDGHDPYRDPAAGSPLRDARWIDAPPDRVAEIAALAGFEPAPIFDPAGMLATGELIPARCTNEALSVVGSYDAMFEDTGDLIRAADVAVSPLEVTLTDLSPPTPCVSTFVLQGPAAAVDAIAAVGIDVMITAGNHAMDCWSGCSPASALLDTLDNLHAAGLVTAGAGENLEAARTPGFFTVETLNGPVSFAFLGYDSIAAAFYAAGPDNAGTAPLETAYLEADVAAALPLADHVLVGAGWGVEYVSDPIPFQVENARAAIAAGATVVLGNHPHWVQAVEPRPDEGALIAYSFGNFVFDQDWSVETTQGMAMELGFTADRLLGFRIRPVVIRGIAEVTRGLYRPEWVDPATEGAPIMNRIWDATDRLPPP
jgi:poly-gamma-glutamate synthesis protein (capsule biosynthesis protein)